MDSWSSWLMGLIGPLVKRAAVALGFGTVTFTGVSAALESAWSAIQGSFTGLLAEVAALLAIAGFFDAMAITAGGLVSGVAWMILKRWALSAGGSGEPA